MNCGYYEAGGPGACKKRAVYRVHFDRECIRVVKVICIDHISIYKNLTASCFVEFIDYRLKVMV